MGRGNSIDVRLPLFVLGNKSLKSFYMMKPLLIENHSCEISFSTRFSRKRTALSTPFSF